MTVDLTGYVCIDENRSVWGIGKSEDEAEKDAWKWLAQTRPKYGASLDYHPCTEAVLDYVRKWGGGDDVPFKQVRQDGQMCIALDHEQVEERCPYTKDMFSTGEHKSVA